MYQAEPEGRVYARPESKNLWIAFKGPDGKPVRRSAGTSDEREAQAELTRQMTLARSLSFQEAVIDYFETYEGRLRPRTLEGYRVSLRAVAPWFADKALIEIDHELIKRFVRERRKQVSDTSVKRNLAFVSTVLSHAVETLESAPTHNPLLSFSKKRLQENKRTRWLRPMEYERLVAACGNPMERLIIDTAVFTGMRKSEIITLRRHNVDLKRQEIVLYVEHTKGKRERVIPLIPALCTQLEQLCFDDRDDLVFHYLDKSSRARRPYVSFDTWWQRTRRDAKLEDVRFHDLRHTFGSWWAQSGGGLMILRDILGHRSMQMVERYAHLDTAGYREEIERVFKTQFAHSLE